jgi:hypothetical protein
MQSSALPLCPSPLPEDLDRGLSALGSMWAKHPARPRLNAAVIRHWDELIHQWTIDASLPLLVRKQEKGVARGEVMVHESGRELVWTDNSPASWSFMLAFAQVMPTLEEIRERLDRNEVPVAMVIDREMVARSRYKCSRVKVTNPNIYRWKVCHRRPVVLAGRGTVKQRPLKLLQEHFKRFLSPSNMFLVPLELGGLGELPHFIQAIGDDL